MWKCENMKMRKCENVKMRKYKECKIKIEEVPGKLVPSPSGRGVGVRFPPLESLSWACRRGLGWGFLLKRSWGEVSSWERELGWGFPPLERACSELSLPWGNRRAEEELSEASSFERSWVFLFEGSPEVRLIKITTWTKKFLYKRFFYT